MSLQSQQLRQRAAVDRATAASSTLSNVRDRLNMSADRLEALADQSERIERIKKDREDNAIIPAR
ncbi:hypothetical protein [Sphingomonas hylomeconis]|uniref:Uncharacterized protein n=1 Tax=Sphingomonas hylomeconis TaxID=1395958 RepID=A0ABV7STZ3_9SPHN|nr:hypothetical protein [Sphingomonas hylomeconis]